MNSYGRKEENSTCGPRLRFGKYAGRRIDDVPAGSLGWLFEEGRIDHDLRRAIGGELVRRVGQHLPDQTQGAARLHIEGEVGEAVRAIVAAGFRAVTLQVHPDHGGTDDAMRHVLQAREVLREVLPA